MTPGPYPTATCPEFLIGCKQPETFQTTLVLVYGAETWTTKREDSKIQAMEMKFWRAILNKTKDSLSLIGDKEVFKNIQDI